MESFLTPRQNSVVEYIKKHQEQYGISPTVREICANLGLKGPAGIHRILNILKEKGVLVTQPGKNRSWRLAEVGARKAIPVLGHIAAGEPVEAIAQGDEKLPVDPSLFGTESCFALRVQGDSMVEAHILDGDLAIIHPQPTVSSGQIAAVTVEDLLLEATLKIFKKKKGRIELHPANPAYSPLVFEAEEKMKVRVVGRFMGIIRIG